MFRISNLSFLGERQRRQERPNVAFDSHNQIHFRDTWTPCIKTRPTPRLLYAMRKSLAASPSKDDPQFNVHTNEMLLRCPQTCTQSVVPPSEALKSHTLLPRSSRLSEASRRSLQSIALLGNSSPPTSAHTVLVPQHQSHVQGVPLGSRMRTQPSMR